MPDREIEIPKDCRDCDHVNDCPPSQIEEQAHSRFPCGFFSHVPIPETKTKKRKP